MKAEPYTAADALRTLERFGGAVERGNDSHVIVVMPSGIEVPVQRRSMTRPIASIAGRRFADACGITYAEWREAVGHPLVRSSRPKAVAKATQPTTGKRDVINRIAELRTALTAIEQVARQGVRDSAFYRDVLVALADVGRQIDKAWTEATRTGER